MGLPVDGYGIAAEAAPTGCPETRDPKPETRNLRCDDLVETTGLEPVTFSVQGRRSPN